MNWKNKKPFLTIFLCVSLIIISLSNYISLSNANPDFVIETDTEITIENDYFKAVFDSDPSNMHGHIRYFYIKPDDTVNIVATSTWKFLGGHEANSKWGTTTKTATDWASAEKSTETCQIVKQTSSYVVVETVTQWKSGGTYLDMSNIEYTTFFIDKPYYIVSSTRTYNEQVQYNNNYDYCWLFDDTWANRYFWLTHDSSVQNTIDNTMQGHTSVWESRFLERYPWVMMYNDTYAKGHFTILISANPTTQGLGYLATSMGNYKEYQILYGDESIESGESHYFTVVNGIASTSTYVDNLSVSLWSTNAYISEPQTHSVASNNQTANIPSFHQAWALWFKTYTANHFQIGNFFQPSAISYPLILSYVRFYPQYINGSGTYNIYSTPTIYQTWNGTYTNVTTQVDYDSKIRLTTELQLWSDSDPFKLKWTFLTLATLNITELRVYRQYEWNTITHGTTMTKLNASVVKMNVTGYSSAIDEECFTFMNETDVEIDVSTGGGNTWIKWYGLKQSEGEIASGNSYTIELLIQQHRRFSFESRDVFGLDDVLSLGETANDRFEKLCWVKFPLDDNDTPFRINHLGIENGFIFNAERTITTLSFSSVSPSGTTTRVRIYCEDEPTSVSGVNSWSYNVSTSILTLTISHSSIEKIEIYWMPTTYTNHLISTDGNCLMYGGIQLKPNTIHTYIPQFNGRFENITLDSGTLGLSKHSNAYEITCLTNNNINISLYQWFYAMHYTTEFKASSETETSLSFQVNTRDRGEPNQVRGVLTSSYDEETSTLSLTCLNDTTVSFFFLSLAEAQFKWMMVRIPMWMGLCGIVLMVVSPVLVVFFLRSKEYEYASLLALVGFALGFSMMVAWLWG